jgi:hypothetical protein
VLISFSSADYYVAGLEPVPGAVAPRAVGEPHGGGGVSAQIVGVSIEKHWRVHSGEHVKNYFIFRKKILVWRLLTLWGQEISQKLPIFGGLVWFGTIWLISLAHKVRLNYRLLHWNCGSKTLLLDTIDMVSVVNKNVI